MIPEIVKIGPFTVYSYGLMLGIAFIVASILFSKEIERKGLGKNAATEITILAMVFGIIGSKILHLIENFDDFLSDPIGMAFSPGGLTFYGGLILATLAIYIYTRKKKYKFLMVADAASPSLAIAYGIGRIGCHLAGDGDYGIPTNLPWGTNYENGIVKPSYAFRGSDIAAQFPDGIVPDNTPLHPTPIYEFLAALLLLFFLWRLRKLDWKSGRLFGVYLIFSGLFRFLVEFIRLNPHIFLGLSEAQVISIILSIIGIIFWITLKGNQEVPLSITADVKSHHKQNKKK